MRGHVLVLLCTLYFIAYLDRTNISTAAPSIKHALHLSNTELGLALASFSLPYALLQAFGGWLGDRRGPRATLTAVGIVWAFATAATGFANGLIALVAARAALGLGEGPAFPTATRAMATWVPFDRRAFAQGAVHAASRLGGAVAPLAVAAIITWQGWRASFWFIGGFSLIWAFVWLWYFRDDPHEHTAVSRRELRELADDDADSAQRQAPWRSLLQRMLPITAIDFCYGWLLWVYLTWLPSYFADNFHLKLSKYALFSTFVLVGGMLGDWLGGLLSDAVARRTGSLRQGRRLSLQIGLIGSFALLVPVLFVHALVLDTALLAGSFTCLELTNPSLWALPMDIAPRNAGVASGFMNTGFGIAGIVSPSVFGFLLDQGHGWALPIGVSAALVGAAALLAARVDNRPLVKAVPAGTMAVAGSAPARRRA